MQLDGADESALAEIDHGRFATGPDVLIEAEASMIGRGAGLHRAKLGRK